MSLAVEKDQLFQPQEQYTTYTLLPMFAVFHDLFVPEEKVPILGLNIPGEAGHDRGRHGR